MNFKNIFIILFVSFFFFYYTIVNSWFYKDTRVNFVWVSWKNIYLNSDKLNNSIIIFKSKDDISKYKIHSSCLVKTQYLFSKNELTFFSLNVLDKNCVNENFYLIDEKKYIITNTHFKLNLITDFDLYNKLTDYSDKLLANANQKYLSEKNKFKLFASLDNSSPNFDFIKKSRYYDEVDYLNTKIENIIIQRQNKYKIPINGYNLPDGKNLSKLPNSSRPYRANYTNAIHEWWDIDAPAWTEVIAIDDGIIIKIVWDFKFSDLLKLKKEGDLTLEDKIKNLDILRWNQIWLKTMKWDVIFYGHLDKVYDNIKIWDIVYKWQPLWQVWVSWVPDKNYTDYHLHFELRKNPYITSNAWNNSEFDYMNWDWYFKWKSFKYILENQYSIFTK